jgi:hypothetical protein
MWCSLVDYETNHPSSRGLRTNTPHIIKQFSRKFYNTGGTGIKTINRQRFQINQHLQYNTQVPNRYTKRIFYYHSRKTGGTTLERLFKSIAHLKQFDYLVTEGDTLDHKFLELPNTISAISLRHPIERISSLYWYEHVLWWYKRENDQTKCRTFKEWIDAWRDHSEWKNMILKTNSKTVYVEVENYFIKVLIGWDGLRDGPIGQKEFEQAKEILSKFDLVLLKDNINTMYLDYLDKIFLKSPIRVLNIVLKQLSSFFKNEKTREDHLLIDALDATMNANKVCK